MTAMVGPEIFSERHPQVPIAGSISASRRCAGLEVLHGFGRGFLQERKQSVAIVADGTRK